MTHAGPEAERVGQHHEGAGDAEADEGDDDTGPGGRGVSVAAARHELLLVAAVCAWSGLVLSRTLTAIVPHAGRAVTGVPRARATRLPRVGSSPRSRAFQISSGRSGSGGAAAPARAAGAPSRSYRPDMAGQCAVAQREQPGEQEQQTAGRGRRTARRCG